MAEIPHHGEDSKGTVKQKNVKDSEIVLHGEDSKGKSKQQLILHPECVRLGEDFMGKVKQQLILHQGIKLPARKRRPENPKKSSSQNRLGLKVLEHDLIEIGLDKIKLESEISSPGHPNAVWRATYSSPSGPRTVALKNPARFESEEVLILQQLRHPNIIQLLGVAPLPLDGYAIVTEYAERGSLFHLIKQHCYDWSDFKKHRWIKWAVEMARGLQYIHKQKYQHGDVKSPSMVITRDDTLKICDFGTAKHCEVTFSTDSIRGSLAWMAPEAMGDPLLKIKPIVTLKSDVFSYAVVVWELLTGKAPFPEESIFAILKAVAIERRRQEIPTECPESIRDLLTECWNHDYRKRPSMDEILYRFILYTEILRHGEDSKGWGKVVRKATSTREPRIRKSGWLGIARLWNGDSSSDDDSELDQPLPSKRRRITGQFQPDSSGDTKEGNGTSSQPNLLKTLLEEFRKMTAGFPEAELLRRTFKLPYITIAYINERGGSLTLEKYKVHLYIPRDALAKGPPQMVYVFVDPSAPPVDGVNPPYVALSPIIECGPTGLKFLNSVVLSFPHHANNNWEFSTRMCHSDETTRKTWQALDAVRDGTMVLSRDNKVVLLLKHFTRFVAGGVPCEESAKLVKTGAFGSLYDPSDDARYAVRIHVWNNDPVAKEKVIDMEKDMGSKPLDVYRDLQVFYNQGDLNAKIDNIKTGWEIEEKTPKEQKMLKAAVWQLPSNSVTFDLTRETNDGATASVSTQLDTSPPGCDSFVYQLKADSADSKWDWEGQEVRLSIRPKVGKCSLPTEIPDTKRLVEDTCRICHQNPSSNAGICAACWKQVRGAFTKNTGKQTDGGFGGLSKEKVKELLLLLEAKSDGRYNWIRFAEELFDQETSLIDTLLLGEAIPAKEVLKLYFSFKQEDGVPDQDAVLDLLDVFKRLGMNEAVEIVQAKQNTRVLRSTARNDDNGNFARTPRPATAREDDNMRNLSSEEEYMLHPPHLSLILNGKSCCREVFLETCKENGSRVGNVGPVTRHHI